MGKKKSQLFKDEPSQLNAELLLERSKLLHESGDFVAAIDTARQALSASPESIDILTYASWLFSTLDYESDAISVLRKLASVSVISAVQSCHVSGLLFKNGDVDEALDFALAATLKEPKNEFYVQHYASLLNHLGRASEAAPILIRAIHVKNPNASILRQLSTSCSLLNKHAEAENFAKLASAIEPNNVEMALHYASLLMKTGKHDAVIDYLLDCVDRGVYHSFIFIMLSAALGSVGDNTGALKTINEGTRILGVSLELLMQRGGILCGLQRYDDAVEAFQNVLAQNADYPGAKQACLAALTVAGRFEEAIALCAGMLKDAPSDKALYRSLQFLLTQQMYSGDDETGLSTNKFSILRQQQSGLRRPRKKLGPLAIQFRILSALVMREARTRFSGSKLGYAWVVFEPLAHIAIMIVLINTFAHGSPPLGQSFAVFYFTGIIPYHLFTHTSSYLMSAVSGNKSLLQMPTITPFDVTLARAIVEFTTESLVALLLIVGFNIFGFDATPINPLGVIGAFIILWVAGFGMGMINSVLTLMFHGWEKVWGAMIALLYFASGTFYIPSMMPEWIRNILVWNPVLQGIELMRSHFFHEIIPPWLDVTYLMYVTGFLFCAGLLSMRMTRRRASST